MVRVNVNNDNNVVISSDTDVELVTITNSFYNSVQNYIQITNNSFLLVSSNTSIFYKLIITNQNDNSNIEIPIVDANIFIGDLVNLTPIPDGVYTGIIKNSITDEVFCDQFTLKVDISPTVLAQEGENITVTKNNKVIQITNSKLDNNTIKINENSVLSIQTQLPDTIYSLEVINLMTQSKIQKNIPFGSVYDFNSVITENNLTEGFYNILLSSVETGEINWGNLNFNLVFIVTISQLDNDVKISKIRAQQFITITNSTYNSSNDYIEISNTSELVVDPISTVSEFALQINATNFYNIDITNRNLNFANVIEEKNIENGTYTAILYTKPSFETYSGNFKIRIGRDVQLLTNNFLVEYFLNPTGENSNNLRDYLKEFTNKNKVILNKLNTLLQNSYNTSNENFTELFKKLIQYRAQNEELFKQLKVLTNANTLLHRIFGAISTTSKSLSLETLYNLFNNPTPDNLKAFLDMKCKFYSDLTTDLSDINSQLYPQLAFVKGNILSIFTSDVLIDLQKIITEFFESLQYIGVKNK